MIVRRYTGDDGQTHFEDLPLPAEESHNVALQAGCQPRVPLFPCGLLERLAHSAPATIHFYSRGADGNRDRRWHHAPFWTG
jgi:hypothetical protein